MLSETSVVISAFPATGKTWLAERLETVVDSDSSAYSWEDRERKVRRAAWPGNYLAHITAEADKGLTVLVSSHHEVRGALASAGIPFTLVYPSRGLRDEYVQRMRDRGTPELAELVASHWDVWINDCGLQRKCRHVILGPGEYLAHALGEAARA